MATYAQTSPKKGVARPSVLSPALGIVPKKGTVRSLGAPSAGIVPAKGVIRATSTQPGAAGLPAAPAAPDAPPDPHDSTYWTNLVALKNSRAGSYADLHKAATNADTDLGDQTAQLVKARANALLNQKNAANSRGLFYSSYLTNHDRDTNNAYDDQQTGVQNAHDRTIDAINSKLTELRNTLGAEGSDSDFGTSGTALLNEAIARALAAQAAAPPPPAPAAGAAPAPAGGPHGTPTVTPGKDSHGHAGNWHTYPDGRRVFVRS